MAQTFNPFPSQTQAQPSFIFNGLPIQETFENGTPGTVFLHPHSAGVRAEFLLDQKMTFHPLQNTQSGAVSYDIDQDEPEGLNIGDEDENIAPSQLPSYSPENMSNYSPTAIHLPVLSNSTNESFSSVPQFANEMSNVSSDTWVEVCQMQNQINLEFAESIIFSILATHLQNSQLWNLPSITDSNGFIRPAATALLKPYENPGKFGGCTPMHTNPNVGSSLVQEQAKVCAPTPAYMETLAGTVKKLMEIEEELSVEKKFNSEHVKKVFRMNHDEAIRVLENIEESPSKQSTLKIFQQILKIDDRSQFMHRMKKLYQENIFAFGEVMASHAFTRYRPMPKSTDSDYSVCEKLLKWALRLLIFSAEKMNRAMTLCGGNGYQLKFKNRLIKSENWDKFFDGLLEILKKYPKLAKNVQYDVKFSQECDKGKQNTYSAHCALKTLGGNFYLHVNKGFKDEFFEKTEKLRERCEVFFVGGENETRNTELREAANKRSTEKGKQLEPLFIFEERRIYKTASVCKVVKFFQENNIQHLSSLNEVKGCKLVKCFIDDLADFNELRENYEGMRSEEGFAQHFSKIATYCGLLAGSENNTAKLTHKLLVILNVDEANFLLFKKCLKPFDAEGKLQEEEFVKSDPGNQKKNPAKLFRPCGENFFLNEVGDLNEHLETLCRVNEFVTELDISHTEQAELAGGGTYLCNNMTLEKLEQIKSLQFFTSEYVEATAAKFNTKKQKESIPGFGKPSVSFSVRLRQGHNPFHDEIKIAGDFEGDVAVQIKDEFFAKPDANQESCCTGCVSCRCFYVPPMKDKKQKGKKKKRGRKNRQRKKRKI